MRTIIERERTSAEVILYALYLYFLGLSFRGTSKAIQPFGEEGRSHVAVWKWVQRFNPKRLYHCKRVSAFLIDETMLQIGPGIVIPLWSSSLMRSLYYKAVRYVLYIRFGIPLAKDIS
jgi:transposase-like protein